MAIGGGGGGGGGKQTFLSTWLDELYAGREALLDTMFCISIWKSIRTCWHAPAAQLFSLKLSANASATAAWCGSLEAEVNLWEPSSTWAQKLLRWTQKCIITSVYIEFHWITLALKAKPAYSLLFTNNSNNSNKPHTSFQQRVALRHRWFIEKICIKCA